MLQIIKAATDSLLKSLLMWSNTIGKFPELPPSFYGLRPSDYSLLASVIVFKGVTWQFIKTVRMANYSITASYNCTMTLINQI